MVLNGREDETTEVGVIDLVDTNGGMGTMDICSVGTIVAIDLVSTINLVEKKVADVSENWWAHGVKIDGNDEFCDNDIGSTLPIVIINRKVKFSIEIGANTTCKGGLLMLLTTKV